MIGKEVEVKQIIPQAYDRDSRACQDTELHIWTRTIGARGTVETKRRFNDGEWVGVRMSDGGFAWFKPAELKQCGE